MTSIYDSGSLEPWAVLLDRANKGGLEVSVIINDYGFGFLAFDICHTEVDPDAVSAACALTRLFDLGGSECREIVEHCLSAGVIAFSTLKTQIQFNGPVAGLAFRDEAGRGAR